MVPNRPEQHGRVLEGLLCNMRRRVQVEDLTKVGLQRDRGRLDEHLLPDGIQLKTDLTQPRIKQTLAIHKESRRALQVIGQPVHLGACRLAAKRAGSLGGPVLVGEGVGAPRGALAGSATSTAAVGTASAGLARGGLAWRALWAWAPGSRGGVWAALQKGKGSGCAPVPVTGTVPASVRLENEAEAATLRGQTTGSN